MGWADALSLSITSALTCWRIILGPASGLECSSPKVPKKKGLELLLPREERWSLQCRLLAGLYLTVVEPVAITSKNQLM